MVLFSGKFREVKCPLDLLRAFSELSDQVRTALVFVGDGPLRHDMEKFVQEQDLGHIYFMGFRNQMELPKFYAMADVFVLPSGFEPWGLVVNEAMCFGLPVIVSDQVGAGADLVREGENGYVYPVGDIDRLAAILERLLQDAGLRKQMGQRSAEIISSWNYDACVKGILKAMDSVTRRRNRG